MESLFNLDVARKYYYIKCCYEHQAITYLESNGIDIRPTFFNHFNNIYTQLINIFNLNEIDFSVNEIEFWDVVKDLYGIENHIGLINDDYTGLKSIYDSVRRPIFLTCNSYYLPHSTMYNENYQSTRIVVLKLNDDDCLIGDAQNFFYGKITTSELLNAHEGYYNIPIIQTYNSSVTQLNKSKYIKLFLDRVVLSNVESESTYQEAEKIVQNPQFLTEHNIKVINQFFLYSISNYFKVKLFLEWAVGDTSLHQIASNLSKSWQRLQIDYTKALRLNDNEMLVEKLKGIRKVELELIDKLSNIKI